MLGPIIAALGGDLRKGRAHKYLARIPTGKVTKSGKMRWRYVYKYTSSSRKSGWVEELGLINPKLHHGIPVGTSFRDAFSNHNGHWIVTESVTTGKGAFTQLTKIVLTHDEDGSKREFDSKWSLLYFLQTAHRDGQKLETERRKGTVKKKFDAALSAYKTMKARHGARPTMSQLASQKRAFAYALNLARNHPEKTYDRSILDFMFPTEPLKPKRGKAAVTAADVAERIKTLRADLSPYSLSDTSRTMLPEDAGGLPTMELIEKAAELEKLVRAGAYGALDGDYQRLPFEIQATDHAFDGLFSEIGKKTTAPSDATIEKKLREHIKNDRPWAAWGLDDNGLWVQGFDTWDTASARTASVQRGVERLLAFANRKKGWLGLGSAYTADVDQPSARKSYGTPVEAYDRAIDRWAAGEGQSADPNPSMYGSQLDTDVALPTDGDALAKWAYGQDAGVTGLSVGLGQIGARVKSGTIDPIVTISHGPARADYSRAQVTAPLSVIKTALEADRKANITAHRAKHEARVAKLNAATARVSGQIERAGGLPKLKEIAIDAMFSAVKADPDFNGDALTDQVKAELMGKTEQWSRKYTIQDAIGLGYRNDDDATGRGKLRAKLSDMLMHAGRDAVLKHLAAATGSKPDVAHSKSKLRVFSDAEHAEAHAASRPAHADKPAPASYDADKHDPAMMHSLWGFMDASVAPDATMDVYDKELATVTGGTRAHCSWNNRIRLHPSAGDLTSATVWHEYGHAIEHANPGITELTNTLRDVRGAGAKLRTLNEIEGHDSYDEHEKAYLADGGGPANRPWKKSGSYAGKWYGHQGSTEVLAMGAQHLYDDPIGFLAVDPTHAHLTIAALTGQLGAASKRFTLEAKP